METENQFILCLDRSEAMKSKVKLASELVLKFVINCEANEYKISKKLSFTRAESRLLKFFNFQEEQTGIELARSLSLTKSRITFLINSLLKKGIITRKPNPKDRRFLLIRLTEKGKTSLEKLNYLTIQNCTKQFSAFDDKELDSFIHLISKILYQK